VVVVEYVVASRDERGARLDDPAADLQLTAVYQLASDCLSADKTRLFLETCTALAPSTENMRLVRSAASLVRSTLNGADAKPLRDFVRRTAQWCSDVDDVLAAAGQAVVDEMEHLPRANLHDVIRRVAQIERDTLRFRSRRDGEGNFRTAYAS
jgi:hypothetical protein